MLAGWLARRIRTHSKSGVCTRFSRTACDDSSWAKLGLFLRKAQIARSVTMPSISQPKAPIDCTPGDDLAILYVLEPFRAVIEPSELMQNVGFGVLRNLGKAQ